MLNEIIVDVNMGQTRVALLENRELVEFYIENTGNKGIVGNIYVGKVVRVLPGMHAAFIDIGLPKKAFLYAGDIVVPGRSKEEEMTSPIITDYLKLDQNIIVQVTKESIGTKGPKVTTNISIPGRYLVLLPYSDCIGISKRIENEAEKQRLCELASKIKPAGMGLVVRTQGEGKSVSDFSRELAFLLKLWAKVNEKMLSSTLVPHLIHRDFDLLFKIIRDMFTYNIHKLIINDAEQFSRVIEFLDILSPSLKEKVEYYSNDYDIFEFYQVENTISKVLDKRIWLKCGGYIVIDQTEALTAIDVNTGKYVGESDLENTVLKTNLEAAKEVAKQIRLRDIGGIIIIDFIDMSMQEHKDIVINTLKCYLKKDKARSIITGTTPLGLVEMTRKKVRERLTSFMKIDCPYCYGDGQIPSPETVARLAEKEIYKVFNQSIASEVEVQLHPQAAKLLLGNNGANKKRIEKVFNRKITVQSCENFKLNQMVVIPVDG